MSKKNKKRQKFHVKPKAALPPGPACSVGGDHVPLVFPEKAPSPWSSRLDRMVNFDGGNVPEAEGFRVQIAICMKCRLLYMAKYSPTDTDRDAELSALRKELEAAKARLEADESETEDELEDDPEDVDPGDDDGTTGDDDG